MTPTHFLIPADLARRIVAYLGERPYAQVADFVQGLQQMRPVEVQTVAPAPSTAPGGVAVAELEAPRGCDSNHITESRSEETA